MAILDFLVKEYKQWLSSRITEFSPNDLYHNHNSISLTMKLFAGQIVCMQVSSLFVSYTWRYVQIFISITVLWVLPYTCCFIPESLRDFTANIENSGVKIIFKSETLLLGIFSYSSLLK